MTATVTVNSKLLTAVQSRDKAAVKTVLDRGADISNIGDPCDDALYFCIVTSQYEIASIILSHLSSFERIIVEYTPLDHDTTTIILEYFGNVHDQIRFGWSKICQLGWINSMYDLKLLQLLILHGPRNLINRRSPDFDEHCLVSAIKNNCQLMVKIVLCIYRDQLPNNLYSITNDLKQDLKYHLNKIEKVPHKKEMNQIIDLYHNNFNKLQTECFGMILSDKFGKFTVLQNYIQQRPMLFPIIKEPDFLTFLSKLTKQSEEKLRVYIKAEKLREKALKLEEQEKNETTKTHCSYDICLLQ